MPTDIVHPALKRECSIVISIDSRPHRCSCCGVRFIYRNYLHRYSMECLLCSWDCAIEFTDFINWQYEMGRKGHIVNINTWRRTERGTKYFEMLERDLEVARDKLNSQ